MAVFHQRRQSSAALWSRRIAVFSAVLFVTAALSHRFGLVQTIPFFWVLGEIAAFAVLALVLAGTGISRLWNYGDKGGRDSTFAVVVALLTLSPFLVCGYRIAVLPFLSDISTDLADPPRLVRAAGLRTAQMNEIDAITPEEAEAQQRSYPDVSGHRYALPADRVREALDTVLAGQGWLPVDTGAANPLDERVTPETTLELTASTFWLAFPVDVAIRITDEGETTYVDMRSASRYMRHDFGDNSRRITAFFAELDAEIATKFAVAPSDQ